jgi:putative nucleotidyltransferase with HDIG domain
VNDAPPTGLRPGQPQAAATTLATWLRPAQDLLETAQRAHDLFTCEHQQRTTELAVAIGARLALSDARLEVLRLAALLHDVGKMGVPAGIVRKPGELSSSEHALVRAHCAVGHGILEFLEVPFPLPEIVLQHHERLDGTGYPRALAGDEILIEARILAVADAFDAMTSYRGYRAALPAEFALAELTKLSGRALDADAVAACAAHVQAQPERWAPAPGPAAAG